jgi:hypothetical protein
MAKVKNKKISDYTQDSKNINKGSAYGMSLLGNSLEEVGFGRSLLSDKNGVLIAGNKTMEKAGELGYEDVIEVETTGKEIVVIKRKDLDINSEKGAKMKILDNTVSYHNYVEDAEVAEAVCEEFAIDNVKAYGLQPPKLDKEEVSFNVSTKPVLKITFDNFTDRDFAQQEIQDLLKDKWPTALVVAKGK